MSGGTHARSIVVWDVPAAIERGETFCIKVGLKCGAACSPAGWTVDVRDHDGRIRASAPLGPEPWPGTAALHYAIVELEAPEHDGLYAWEAMAPAVALEHPADAVADDATDAVADDAHDVPAEIVHAEVGAGFNVRVVPAPEWRLTVVALDKASRAPVKHAKVVIHPYRASTDERGIAVLRVPKGAYRLFVSGRDYFPFRSEGEVTSDITITAELEPDLPPSDAELWA